MQKVHGPETVRRLTAGFKRRVLSATKPGPIWRHTILSVLLAALCPGWAVAEVQVEPTQSLDEIRQAAHDFVLTHFKERRAPPRVEVGRLDRRLRLAPCASDLEAFLPPGSRRLGNIVVGVRCAEPKPWSLYVPARVRLLRRVLVLARPVARGTTLTAGDVRLETRDVDSLTAGYLVDPAEVVGMRTARNLKLGQPLNRLVLSIPKLVRRGQRVLLLAQGSGLKVRMQGEALKDGAHGDRVRVRNLRSKREVEGVVTAAGIVEVPM